MMVLLAKMEQQRLNLPCYLKQQINKSQILLYEATIFKMMTINHWKTVISYRQETSGVSPLIATTYYLEKISRTQCRKKEHEQNLEKLLHWGASTESASRPKQLQSTGQSTREERTTQKEKAKYLQSIQGNSDQHMHVKELLRTGKEPSRRN